MSKKITLRFIGTDGWSRCVFKGDDERYYKTVELDPDEGFLKVSCTEQIAASCKRCIPRTSQMENLLPVQIGEFYLQRHQSVILFTDKKKKENTHGILF